MHRRKKFPKIKCVFFHLLVLCTKFQSSRFNNKKLFQKRIIILYIIIIIITILYYIKKKYCENK